jgi:hypothetical protein
MAKITRESLMTLEAYSVARKEFRSKVMAHKRLRTVAIGANVTVVFEDELTMRYQIQEMLRVERIFEAEGIDEELDAYNPLVPDGSNWKATMLIEYPDIDERRLMLARLIGIEDRVFVEVEGSSRVYAIADEDLDRENEQKTASVHFLRFELLPDMVSRLRAGAALAVGIDHPQYRHAVAEIAEPVRAALMADLK